MRAIVVVILALMICFTVQLCVYASETEKELGISKNRNVVKIIKPSETAKIIRGDGHKIAVVITSSDLLLGQVGEDYMVMKLKDLHYDVVERTSLSEGVMAELKRIEKQTDKEDSNAINITQIGQKIGLDAIIVGTLFEGRRQYGTLEKDSQRSMDKIVVATCYLQVVDVRTEKTVLGVIMEYDNGENITNAIDTAVRVLSEEM